MNDASSKLRTATRRAKSDVANKLVSMFLHELSRSISQSWHIRVDSAEYELLVREHFGNRCPYCSLDLSYADAVVEHLEGMNRYRGGLHVPGNVLVACSKCNCEKRRDDSMKTLTLATSGWESFLSHDGQRCAASCRTCAYWTQRWPERQKRVSLMNENRERILRFRRLFALSETGMSLPVEELPAVLIQLYTDCQAFAENEIKSLLDKFGTGVTSRA